MPFVKEQLNPYRTKDDISELIMLVSTTKGLFFYYSDMNRRHWDVNGPYFLGTNINHAIINPNDNNAIMVLGYDKIKGPQLFRSENFGKNWIETKGLPQLINSKNQKQIKYFNKIVPTDNNNSSDYYLCSYPIGIFQSNDKCKTWKSVIGFNENNNWPHWVNKYNSKINALIINPDDRKHLYIGFAGGVMESLNKGESWNDLNNGISNKFDTNIPYCLVMNKKNTNLLYQQNKSGIFSINRPNNKWEHIGKNLPSEIGDNGLSIISHPRNPNIIWCMPLDMNKNKTKYSIDGQPALYCSHNSGKKWFRQDIGLPMRNAWFSITNNSLKSDSHDSVGLYFGTTSGSIWMSDHEGDSWRQIAINLPQINGIEVGVIPK